MRLPARHAKSVDEPIVMLAHLVAVDWIDQVVGEIGVEIEFVADDVRAQVPLSTVMVAMVRE